MSKARSNQLRAPPGPADDSWIAGCALARELSPLSNLQDYADFAEHEAPNLSYEDNRRGMTRGANHSMLEVAGDTEREQKDQVGRQKTAAIMRSTGLRRRERRFESCRGRPGPPVVPVPSAVV